MHGGNARSAFQAILIALGAALLSLPAAAQDTVTHEQNTNRFGADYKGFDLPEANSQMCRQACIDDDKCRAYTYVKPDVQGPKARCYLKDPAPAAKFDACCVSGVKMASSQTAFSLRSGRVTFTGPVSAEISIANIFPAGAELFYWSGDIKQDFDRRVYPGDFDPVFFWDVSKIRGNPARAILWQASVKPFPPFAGGGPSTWNPDGLVASGIIHDSDHFTFRIAGAISEAQRQTRKPTLVFGDGALCEHANCDGFRFVACGAQDGRGELISYPKMHGYRLDWCKHFGRECGEPAATLYCREKGYERAVRWAIDPKIGAGEQRKDKYTFYVRIVPLSGHVNPQVVGQPSNVIPVLYNQPEIPPDFRFYTEETARTPAPAYQLTALRYQAQRAISKWPAGCKEPTGKTREPPGIVKAFVKAWNLIDEAYDKVQGFVVETFDTITFGAIPKGVWEFGLDAAMMYAGLPPDIPNLEEMFDHGVDYVAAEVARAAVQQVPAGSVVPGTGDLVTDVLVGAAEGATREQLEDSMRREIENRTRQAILSGRAELEKQIKKEYKYCVTKRLYPTYFVTVRNTSGRDIPNFTVTAMDTEQIFQSKTMQVMLRAGQTMTIPLAPEKNVRPLPDRWQFVGANESEEISRWWNEFYMKRQTKIVVRATGDYVCRDPLGPQGLTCGEETKAVYISPQPVILNRDHNLLQ